MKTVEFHTTGVSYLGVGGKVGKILVGNAAFEFYADANVEDYIQIPWQEIERIGANVSGRKISRHFEIYTMRIKNSHLLQKTFWKNFKDSSGNNQEMIKLSNFLR